MTSKKDLLERNNELAGRLIEARQECAEKNIEIGGLHDRLNKLRNDFNLEWDLHGVTTQEHSKAKWKLDAEVKFRSQLHEVVDYFLDRLKLADKYTLHSNSEGAEIEPELDIENLLADVRLATKRADVSAARKRLGLKE